MEQDIKKVMMFNFNKTYQAPGYKLNKGRELVEWGQKNDFPEYLLDIYNHYGSATHKAIIDKKVRMIAGQGFEDITDASLLDFVKKNKLDIELAKMALDYEIFNGFCFEIIWNKEGNKINKIKHINFQNIRIGYEREMEEGKPFYWYSEDWLQYRKEEYRPTYIKGYDPEEPGGRQLYYYTEYNPQSTYYPIPQYSNVFNYIELDYEISSFHLSGARNGYSPSFILNFATGLPTEEEQDQFAKSFKREYQGTDNNGNIIITWSEGSEQAPEMIPVQSNDSDDRFVNLEAQIKDEIIRGSGVPLQLLSLVPGKLGSSEERLELMKEFQMDYISPRQVVLEDALNEVLNIDLLRLKKYTE
jgi:hypothetical protein